LPAPRFKREAAQQAGNPPTERVAKLRQFWREITANLLLDGRLRPEP
jgi:hypothetical protein